MNIDARKLAFIQRFSRVQNESTLEKLEQLLELEESHFQPISEDQYGDEVKEGLEDYSAGRTTSQDDFENEIKNWD